MHIFSFFLDPFVPRSLQVFISVFGLLPWYFRVSISVCLFTSAIRCGFCRLFLHLPFAFTSHIVSLFLPIYSLMFQLLSLWRQLAVCSCCICAHFALDFVSFVFFLLLYARHFWCYNWTIDKSVINHFVLPAQLLWHFVSRSCQIVETGKREVLVACEAEKYLLSVMDLTKCKRTFEVLPGEGFFW